MKPQQPCVSVRKITRAHGRGPGCQQPRSRQSRSRASARAAVAAGACARTPVTAPDCAGGVASAPRLPPTLGARGAGEPDGSWTVDQPAEEVPAELPEPCLGINFARDGMARRDWLSLIAVHSDAWLLRCSPGCSGAHRDTVTQLRHASSPVWPVLCGWSVCSCPRMALRIWQSIKARLPRRSH